MRKDRSMWASAIRIRLQVLLPDGDRYLDSLENMTVADLQVLMKCLDRLSKKRVRA